jgi:hypothetical protein
MNFFKNCCDEKGYKLFIDGEYKDDYKDPQIVIYDSLFHHLLNIILSPFEPDPKITIHNGENVICDTAPFLYQMYLENYGNAKVVDCDMLIEMLRYFFKENDDVTQELGLDFEKYIKTRREQLFGDIKMSELCCEMNKK